ncbi:MAG TPA: hypothetical protein VF238_06695 [Methylomirabilota bacterium]
MADQPGIMGPEVFPIRDPRTKGMTNGRILNSARYIEIGGLDGPSKWAKAYNTSDQAGSNNVITLEKGGPTGVKAGKRAASMSPDAKSMGV